MQEGFSPLGGSMARPVAGTAFPGNDKDPLRSDRKGPLRVGGRGGALGAFAYATAPLRVSAEKPVGYGCFQLFYKRGVRASDLPMDHDD